MDIKQDQTEDHVGGKRKTRGYHPRYGEAPFASFSLATRKRQKTVMNQGRRVSDEECDNPGLIKSLSTTDCQHIKSLASPKNDSEDEDSDKSGHSINVELTTHTVDKASNFHAPQANNAGKSDIVGQAL